MGQKKGREKEWTRGLGQIHANKVNGETRKSRVATMSQKKLTEGGTEGSGGRREGTGVTPPKHVAVKLTRKNGKVFERHMKAYGRKEKVGGGGEKGRP